MPIPKISSWYWYLPVGTLLACVGSAPADVAPVRNALMIVADTGNLNYSDKSMQQWLRSQRFQVNLANDESVSLYDARDECLVVISATSESRAVGTRLNDTPAGILLLEDDLLDEMFGIPADKQGHYPSNRLDIESGTSHPMAAGLARQRDVVVYDTFIPLVTELSWGAPNRANPHVVIVASNEFNSPDVHVFAYDRGALFDNGRVATGRRTFFFLYNDSFRHLTPVGLALFGAAVRWTNESANNFDCS